MANSNPYLRHDPFLMPKVKRPVTRPSKVNLSRPPKSLKPPRAPKPMVMAKPGTNGGFSLKSPLESHPSTGDWYNRTSLTNENNASNGVSSPRRVTRVSGVRRTRPSYHMLNEYQHHAMNADYHRDMLDQYKAQRNSIANRLNKVINPISSIGQNRDLNSKIRHHTYMMKLHQRNMGDIESGAKDE